jgi:hypothetical protein
MEARPTVGTLKPETEGWVESKEAPKLKINLRGTLGFTGSGLPYNKRIELTARGRHGACLRKPRAGSPPAAGLPPSACGPCSQLIRALYGRGLGCLSILAASIYFCDTKKPQINLFARL